ncbi:hypothetical protein HQ865_11320 [Mucilaginibacter mali]|uniref:Uncharacterized protein n=1 Tax=Mucilaginibacter mali TaxID=2740462 RepID=A0A7D4Q9T6_9SPHI|nr:hypothetical protein [Mucilaginibacter mali]QKJ30325.1 hypothetical protein HQ865_11320 [Mucilaginibacter mali]
MKPITSVLIIFVNFYFYKSLAMSKNHTIPQTIIRAQTIYTDFGFLKDRGKVLFITPKCVIVGIGEMPFMLLGTPQFSIENLPPNIKKNADDIKMLVLQSTFSTEPYLKDKVCKIPSWVTFFKNAKYIKLNHVDLTQLSDLANLVVEHLVLINVKYTGDDKVIAAIKKLQYLKYIAYDGSLSITLINAIKLQNPKVILLPESEYYERRLQENL